MPRDDDRIGSGYGERDDAAEIMYAASRGHVPTPVPQDMAIEQGVLGALLIDNRIFERISEFLEPGHFFAPVHGRIYEAISKILRRGETASPTKLKLMFADDHDLAGHGGAGYLADLMASVLAMSTVEDHARFLVDLHGRRELITIGEEIVRSARVIDADDNAASIMERAEQDIFKLSDTDRTATGPKPLGSVLLDVIDTAQRAHRREPGAFGISTGLTDLNKKLGGLRPSDVIVLAARPSMGKTSLATNIAFQAAHDYARTNGAQGCPVLFFSLEMSSEELGHRIVCQQSGTDSSRVQSGDLDDNEFRRLIESTQLLASVPLYIDETPALSLAQVRTRARRQKRQGGLGLIVIDYLQLLRGSGSKQSSDSRVNEVSEITRGIKVIAKELKVPVLALSQLSRAVEQRDDKRPQLADLRESGTIEQDSDVVIFVYREEYYLTRDEPAQLPRETAEKFVERQSDWSARKRAMANVGELIISKQRKGPTCTVRVHWDGPTTSFSDLHAYYSGGLSV